MNLQKTGRISSRYVLKSHHFHFRIGFECIKYHSFRKMTIFKFKFQFFSIFLFVTFFHSGITQSSPDTLDLVEDDNISVDQGDEPPEEILKIIGGEEVNDPTAYPYQVFIEKIWNNTAFFKCGGTVYNDRYVVTAGHCTYFKDAEQFATPKQMWVTAGTIDLTSTDEEIRRDKQVVGVSEIHTHPDFKFMKFENDRGETPIYDIAVLKLKKPLKLSDRVAPLQLPPDNLDVKGNGTVTGWGRKELNGTIQNRMRTIDVPFLELKRCKKLFKWVATVNDDMVCTGTDDGGVTPCYGDSGGPVRCESEGKQYFCGVSSFNGNNCANYNVYTRVSSYNKWIRSIAGPQ